LRAARQLTSHHDIRVMLGAFPPASKRAGAQSAMPSAPSRRHAPTLQIETLVAESPPLRGRDRTLAMMCELFVMWPSRKRRAGGTPRTSLGPLYQPGGRSLELTHWVVILPNSCVSVRTTGRTQPVPPRRRRVTTIGLERPRPQRRRRPSKPGQHAAANNPALRGKPLSPSTRLKRTWEPSFASCPTLGTTIPANRSPCPLRIR
jgi:hypothetical protein